MINYFTQLKFTETYVTDELVNQINFASVYGNTKIELYRKTGYYFMDFNEMSN